MKKKFLAALTSAICIAAAIPSSFVYADGQKVVTLGADITEEQKQAILRYFGVAGKNLLTLTVTNQDERAHLGSYVPLEQIGTRTISCALVNPTNSGGIQVKTANLSWVTSNMIASTLSTSGVVNCEVLAAAPFEVSGTGALTGIMMAYESAVGESLDTTKKDVATQELITTTQIANNIGQVNATEIVNESKMQVIQGDVVNADDINVIINEIAEEENISLSDEDRELLRELLQQIAEQDYNYEEMKETLERVEANMADLNARNEEEEEEDPEPLVIDGGSSETEETEETETPETLADDSILMNTDDSALGDSVIFDATDDDALAETEFNASEEESDLPFEITNSDSYGDEEDPFLNIPSYDDDDEFSDWEEETNSFTDSSDEATNPEENLNTETPAEEEDPISFENQTEEEDPASSEFPSEDAALTQLPISDFDFAPITSDSNAYETFQAGTNELEIRFQRNDLVAGSGTLTVYNAQDGSTIETVQMSDSTKAVIKPLDADELMELGWAEGNKAVITLSRPLEQNSSYFVALSEDALMTLDGTAHSEATPDSFTWTIDTDAYGFCLNKTAADITAGSTLSGQILMDGSDASYACIENADDAAVVFDVVEFWASGSLNATFQQPGKTSFQVVFYDDQGNILYTVDFEVEVK